jgi:molybdopterin molybdotransferase
VEPVTYQEALRIVLEQCRALPPEEVPFDSAVGRVLAEDVRAATPEPPAAKSAMDGFALRAGDTAGATPAAPRSFAYTDVLGAGRPGNATVAAGGAARIMTGALLPPGADAVVKQEDTQRDEQGRFAVTAPLRPGENVIEAGAILRPGQLLVPAGQPVSPQALSLLAGQGRARWRVYRRPRVALLALGDELVEPGQPLRPGQLYVSNLYVAEALCARYGAQPHRLGIAGDDPQRIEAIVHGALEGSAGAAPCDVLITLGGSHQGDFDFADRVLTRLGAALRFRRTRIGLGGSTLFATRGEALCFGLPGTPLPAWLAFEMLVRPALWKLAGRARLERTRVQAGLSEALAMRPGRTHFIPARVELDAADGPRVVPLVRGTPLALPPSLLANGLIHWPESVEALPAGSPVPVELLGED